MKSIDRNIKKANTSTLDKLVKMTKEANETMTRTKKESNQARLYEIVSEKFISETGIWNDALNNELDRIIVELIPDDED